MDEFSLARIGSWNFHSAKKALFHFIKAFAYIPCFRKTFCLIGIVYGEREGNMSKKIFKFFCVV